MKSASDGVEQRISHYRVLGALGAGGMGEVYAGFDETLKRRVALKSIRSDCRLDAESKVRFLREARLLSQLDHPNICRVHDYVEEGDNAWLVLELIEGRNLRDAVAGLDRPRRLRIAEQIAGVLVATHAAGVIHRDLKPGNVMVTTSGEVKVLDFGLARSTIGPEAAGTTRAVEAVGGVEVARAAPRATTVASDATQFRTQAGTISGTIAYTTRSGRCRK